MCTIQIDSGPRALYILSRNCVFQVAKLLGNKKEPVSRLALMHKNSIGAITESKLEIVFIVLFINVIISLVVWVTFITLFFATQ